MLQCRPFTCLEERVSQAESLVDDRLERCAASKRVNNTPLHTTTTTTSTTTSYPLHVQLLLFCAQLHSTRVAHFTDGILRSNTSTASLNIRSQSKAVYSDSSTPYAARSESRCLIHIACSCLPAEPLAGNLPSKASHALCTARCKGHCLYPLVRGCIERSRLQDCDLFTSSPCEAT